MNYWTCTCTRCYIGWRNSKKRSRINFPPADGWMLRHKR